MNKKRIAFIAILCAIMITLALLPLVIKKDNIINLFVLILLYTTLASSWNILGGYTGQTNLGHAAFFGMGSLITRLLWIKGIPFVPSFLAGGIVAAIITGAHVPIVLTSRSDSENSKLISIALAAAMEQS